MNPGGAVSRKPLDARLEESIGVTSFEVSDQDFALEVVGLVGMVSPSIELRPEVPGTLVCGVQTVRNEHAPVVSLRARFGLQVPAASSPESRVLLVEIDDHVFGLLVDAVRTTRRVLRTEIEPVPARVCADHARHLRGVLRVGGRMTLLIDVDRLLSADERAMLLQYAARSGGLNARHALRAAAVARDAAPA